VRKGDPIKQAHDRPPDERDATAAVPKKSNREQSSATTESPTDNGIASRLLSIG
jgi:hypothetical protein